ncbi:MAG: hypothetical protein ACOVN2_12430, partial [Usitatibacteraceae bacterium]
TSGMLLVRTSTGPGCGNALSSAAMHRCRSVPAAGDLDRVTLTTPAADTLGLRVGVDDENH